MRARVARRRGTRVQRSVLVSRPGDAHERRADAVAGAALGGVASHLGASHAPDVSSGALTEAADATALGGRALGAAERAYFEPRFGRDLSTVRLHTGARAGAAAAGIGAEAFAHGQHIAFAPGAYAPQSPRGRQVLAHEIAHTQASGGPTIQRLCTANNICNPPSGGPVAGSAEGFSEDQEAEEADPRARRRGMTPTRARSSGHAGRARQLEQVLTAHDASRVALVHGIFIDADLADGSSAMLADCGRWARESLPTGDTDPDGFAAATKRCIFVPGKLNRGALKFNRGARRIFGETRDAWHAEALAALVHESEHARFEDTISGGLTRPASVTTATCTHAATQGELSEIVALASEFPTHFDAAEAETSPSGPAHQRLDANIDFIATFDPNSESIPGSLQALGCKCECNEVETMVTQTMDAVTTGWTTAQKAGLRTALRGRLPNWPAAPSP
ncbi:DUF4157 domain-containing protein [uncultured Tateyamaria sp.]|uniref:eCIS core domain-containing protein n=1 Tax=uncultured Tateyamaria sp. TaxID=455651 RepID=UPI00261F49B8|nr:DUF4157 domain-containing protein [uncultured Tateyamaria sp.]